MCYTLCPPLPEGQQQQSVQSKTHNVSVGSCLEKRWKLANASDASMRASKGATAVDPGEI